MDRRDMLKGAAAAGVLLATPASSAVLKGEIRIDRKLHPVTDKFQIEVLAHHPDLADMSHDQLCAVRDQLLEISNRRANYELEIPREPMAGMLTVREQHRLDCAVKVINCHRAVRWLQGRPHTDFGFVGVDQVHGNRVTHECGCVTQHAFDHHKAMAGEPVEHFAHFSMKTCAKHAPLMASFDAHRAQVIKDS